MLGILEYAFVGLLVYFILKENGYLYNKNKPLGNIFLWPLHLALYFSKIIDEVKNGGNK